MAKLIHHSPLGALSIPGVLGLPEPGEPFDIDDDLAESLLAQGDLYEIAPDEIATVPKEPTVPELRERAVAAGIDTAGLKKPELIAALAAADTEGASE